MWALRRRLTISLLFSGELCRVNNACAMLGPLIVLLPSVVIAKSAGPSSNLAPIRPTPRNLRYTHFIEAVRTNRIARVLISPIGYRQSVVENDGNRAVVTLVPTRIC